MYILVSPTSAESLWVVYLNPDKDLNLSGEDACEIMSALIGVENLQGNLTKTFESSKDKILQGILKKLPENIEYKSMEAMSNQWVNCNNAMVYFLVP